MKLLDKYVITNYIMKLFWAILAATVVFLVIDVVENLDKFIDAKVSPKSIFRYYYLFIPYIVYLILPVATLLATLFTIGGLTITNELMAMQLQGVPFIRTLGLLLGVTCLTAAGAFFIGETVIPQANKERMDIERYEVKRLPRESRAKYGKLYIQLDEGRHLYIARYNPATREAYGIELVDVRDGKVTRRTDADKMIWFNKKWNIQGAVSRLFDVGGKVDWKQNENFSLSGVGLKPEEFEKVQTKPEEMNWYELKSFIRRLKNSGSNTLRWEVDLLFKVSLPAAAVIIVLFGAPIASIRRRGGTALGFGLSLFICFIYFGFIQVGKVMGYNGTLEPLLSAWIGNIFFGILGILILLKTSN